MKVKKFILLYGISMVVGLYTTFVLTMLWNWFVVPAFHLTEISFWIMYGLTMLMGLFQSRSAELEAQHRHKILAVMLDACIPNDRRAEVTEQLTDFTEEIWYDAGSKVLGQVGTNSLTLVIGFVIHAFVS